MGAGWVRVAVVRTGARPCRRQLRGSVRRTRAAGHTGRVHRSSSLPLVTALLRPTSGVALGVLACVLNLSFAVESLLPGPALVGATAVSDLSAPGRPWNWLFRAADVGSGMCLLVLCVVLLARRPRGGARSARIAWVAATVATAVFAVSTVVAATVTETCAPPFDPSCPGSMAEASMTDLVHDAVSSVGSTAGVLAVLAFAVLLRRTRWLASLHGAAFAAAAASGLVFVAWQAQPDDDLSGWAQRVQIVALSAWFVLLGLTADRQVPRVSSTTQDHRERMRP